MLSVLFCRSAKTSLSLYLAGNNKLITPNPPRLVDDDALVLHTWLGNCSLVTSLDLRYNFITDKGIKHIADLIAVRKQKIRII